MWEEVSDSGSGEEGLCVKGYVTRGRARRDCGLW